MGSLCFSVGPCNEILDGAKGLPAPLCNAEVDAGGDGALRHLRKLWIPERH